MTVEQQFPRLKEWLELADAPCDVRRRPIHSGQHLKQDA
jgi:hypothetical protein